MKTVKFMGLFLVLAVLAGCAAPQTATVQPAAATPIPTAGQAVPVAAGALLKLAQDAKLGSFLVDEQGMTLYLFTKDTTNASTCYDACATNWPALLTTGAPQAGAGVDAALLGTTTRTDGQMQVTYNGHPLYTFAKDAQPGDTNGQEVNGVWYVVSAQGEEIESPEAAAPTAPAGAQGTTVQVSIKDFSFGDPLTVAPGTTVVWTNDDGATHTVTAANGAFDSGQLAAGASFSFTFTEPGTYDYSCQLHSSMQGQVIVTAP